MLRRTLFVFSLILFAAYPIAADSFVIASGSATFTRSGGFAHTTLGFSGQGFSVNAAGDAFFGPNACPRSCVPGGPISLTYNPYLSFSDWIAGGATINGAHYLFSSGGPFPPSAPAVHFSFAGIFTAPLTSIPITDAETINVTSPFTFNGNMGGRSAEGQMFAGTLTGGGYATMTLTRFTPTGDYLFSSVAYNFVPVPEPATIFLLASGLVGVAGIVRRKRRGVKSRP